MVQDTYTIDPKRLKKNKTEIGCVIVFLTIWIPVTIFTTLFLIFYPNWFLYFWVTAAWLGTVMLLFNFTFMKRKISFRVEGDDLVITGLNFSPRGEKRIHKNDLEALALEAYDDESFLSLTLWKKGAVLWRIPLTSFIHPRHLVVIFEDIKQFLQEHGFDFTARSSMSTEEGWRAIGTEEDISSALSKKGRIARSCAGVAAGVILTLVIIIISVVTASLAGLHDTSIIFYTVSILTIIALAFFIGGYVTAGITRENKLYDVMIMSVLSLSLFVASFLVITKDAGVNEFPHVLLKVIFVIYLMFLILCSIIGGRIKKKRLNFKEK